MDSQKIFLASHEGYPVIFIEGDMTSDSDENVMSLYSEAAKTSKILFLIFNFQKTTYINSAGIATLINVIQEVNDSGGKVSFVGLSNHFLKVMDIVGISDFVDIFDTNDQAVSKINSK
ncbi:MAG TPA: STAS domain-containing protein [Spirochaetota bacterium]